ncbi:MAG TPA: R3H domain-containing nucleic acid-binding protein [Candidatus Bipolaricaulota bacterium]
MNEAKGHAEPQDVADPVIHAVEGYLNELLRFIEPTAQVDVRRKEKNVRVHITQSAAFASREGAVIQSLEHLVELCVRRTVREEVRVEADVSNFRQRRTEELQQLARQLAQQAQDQGKAVLMEPMTAWERKIVHEVLESSKAVRTFSRGDIERGVVIEPVAQKPRAS